MGRRWHTRKTALRVTANCPERAGMWALASSWVRVRVRGRGRGRVRGRVKGRVKGRVRVRRRVRVRGRVRVG